MPLTKDFYRTVFLTLGFANSQGFTERFPGVLGWQCSFHALLFCNIPHQRKMRSDLKLRVVFADLTLLWCNNVKPTTLPAANVAVPIIVLWLGGT